MGLGTHVTDLDIAALGSMPWDNTEIERDIGIPLPMLASRLKSIDVTNLRNHGKYDLLKMSIPVFLVVLGVLTQFSVTAKS